MPPPRDLAALRRHALAAGDRRLAALLGSAGPGRRPPRPRRPGRPPRPAARAAYATLAVRLEIAAPPADDDHDR